MEENSKDNNFSEFDIHMYQDEFWKKRNRQNYF